MNFELYYDRIEGIYKNIVLYVKNGNIDIDDENTRKYTIEGCLELGSITKNSRAYVYHNDDNNILSGTGFNRRLHNSFKIKAENEYYGDRTDDLDYISRYIVDGYIFDVVKMIADGKFDNIGLHKELDFDNIKPSDIDNII